MRNNTFFLSFLFWKYKYRGLSLHQVYSVMNTLFNTINCTYIYKSSVILFVKFQERPKKDYNVESVDQRKYLSCSFFNRVFILIASPSRSWNNQIYLRLNENILKFFPAARQSGRSFFSCSFERQPKKEGLNGNLIFFEQPKNEL